MDLTVEGEDAQRLQEEVTEGIRFVETYARRFFERVEAQVTETTPGVLEVVFDKKKVPVQKARHLITFDPEVYGEVEEEGAELITPASPLFRIMLSLSEQFGPLGLLRDRKRGTPYTMFHFHVHLEGMNFEWDELVSVAVDDDGDALTEDKDASYLLDAIDLGALETIDDPDTVDAAIRAPPEMALDRAAPLLRQRIGPKLDELAGAVEAGLRKTHERIHSYYEQMRDEIRQEEIKLRRRIGELNSRLWRLEDRVKRMALEKEREVLTEDLNQIKTRTAKGLEQLEFEENERLAKESERAQPKVKLVLAAATRVVT